LPHAESFSSNFDRRKLGLRYAMQKLPVLGGLRPEERLVLEADPNGNFVPTEARVAMAEGWFMRRLLARQKFEQGESSSTSPPILSRLYQVISDGTLWFGTACKAADVQFPFPYQNFVEVTVWIFTFMAPVVINGIVFETASRLVGSFICVFAYHALKHAGDTLEDPYLPYDPNDLPLTAWQESFNRRLLAFSIVTSEEDILWTKDIGIAEPPFLDKQSEQPVKVGAGELVQCKDGLQHGLADELVETATPINRYKAQGPLQGCFSCLLPATYGAPFLAAGNSED